MSKTLASQSQFNGHFQTDSWTNEQEVFATKLRNQPNSALNHFRELQLSRKPGRMNSDHPLVRAAEVVAARISIPNPGKKGKTPLSTTNVEEFGIDFWRACISSELLLLLIDMFTDPFLAEQPERYFDSLLACMTGLLHIWIHVRQPSSNRAYPRLSQHQIQHFMGAFVSIEDVWVSLWDHKELFVVGSVEQSLWRITTIERMASAVHKITKPDYLEIYVTDYASRIGHVAMYAWVLLHPGYSLAPYSKSHSIPRTSHQAPSILLTIVNTKEEYNDEGSSAYFLDFIESVGPFELVRAFQGALAESDLMVNNALYVCLEAMSRILRVKDDRINEACWEMPLLVPLHLALARHLGAQHKLDFGSRNKASRILDVLIATKAAVLLETLGNGLAQNLLPSQLVPAVVTWGVLEYMLGTLTDLLELDLSPTDKQYMAMTDKFYSAFSSVVEIWCDGIRNNKGGFSAAMVEDLRIEASETWYSTLRQLRRAVFKSTTSPLHSGVKTAGVWVRLGKVLGMDETVEREAYYSELTHHCSWHSCKYHSEPMPSQTKLRKCTHCKSTYYCSRSHQLSDWKDSHRDSCGPHSVQPHEPVKAPVVNPLDTVD